MVNFFFAFGIEEFLDMTGFRVNFTDGSELSSPASVSVLYGIADPGNQLRELLTNSVNPAKSIRFNRHAGLRTGSNTFMISLAASPDDRSERTYMTIRTSFDAGLTRHQ